MHQVIGQDEGADLFLHGLDEFPAAEHLVTVRTRRAHRAVFFQYVVQVEGAAVAVDHDNPLIFSMRLLQTRFHGRTDLRRLHVQPGVNRLELGIPAVFPDDVLDLPSQGGAGDE